MSTYWLILPLKERRHQYADYAIGRLLSAFTKLPLAPKVQVAGGILTIEFPFVTLAIVGSTPEERVEWQRYFVEKEQSRSK